MAGGPWLAEGGQVGCGRSSGTLPTPGFCGFRSPGEGVHGGRGCGDVAAGSATLQAAEAETRATELVSLV